MSPSSLYIWHYMYGSFLCYVILPLHAWVCRLECIHVWVLKTGYCSTSHGKLSFSGFYQFSTSNPAFFMSTTGISSPMNSSRSGINLLLSWIIFVSVLLQLYDISSSDFLPFGTLGTNGCYPCLPPMGCLHCIPMLSRRHSIWYANGKCSWQNASLLETTIALSPTPAETSASCSFPGQQDSAPVGTWVF